MKKIVLTALIAKHVSNLESVSLTTNGGDVIVTGQNGAGKTTIKNAILWTMLGSTADGEKLIPKNGKNYPEVEIELTDGEIYTQIRKTLQVEKNSASTNCYICGSLVRQKDISKVFPVSEKELEILLELGSFFKLKSAEQRKILTEKFADIKDAEIIALNEEFKELDLKGLTVESYGLSLKEKMRRIKQARMTIPAQIEELTRQQIEVEDNRDKLEDEIAEFETKLKQATAKFKELQEKNQREMKPRLELQARISDLNNEIYQMRGEYAAGKEKISRLESQREEMRLKWSSVGEKCPTCGQSIKSEKAALIRKEIEEIGLGLSAELETEKSKLAQIIERGKNLSEEKNKKDSEYEKMTDEKIDYDALNEMIRKRDEIQAAINARKNRIKEIVQRLEINEKNQRRILDLKAEEKKYGKEKIECEKQMSLLDKFTLKKMEEITGAINSNFQFVKFEMYETLKNGEVRNICEAQMDGVPYENLSKGEKLKAALDVLQAFQKVAGVMFPVLIDDAESYTSNSLTEVPNQKIMFRVVEGGALAIDVKPMMLKERLIA